MPPLRSEDRKLGRITNYPEQGLPPTRTTGTNEGYSPLRVNPVSGVGAGGWSIAYDSAITETLVSGGAIGLVCYVAVLIGVFLLAIHTTDPDRRMLTYLFAILLAGSSFGFSPLTANRVSTIVWLLIALFVLAQNSESPTATENRTIDRHGG